MVVMLFDKKLTAAKIFPETSSVDNLLAVNASLDLTSTTVTSTLDTTTATSELSFSVGGQARSCNKIWAVFNFITESREYKDPSTHGWRIKFRRIFLSLGVIFFTYQVCPLSQFFYWNALWHL